MTTGASLVATDLGKAFVLPRRALFGPAPRVVAVDDVSFSVAPGTTLGIVGESGSGKTTVARMLLRLERPSRGRILLDGRDLGAASPQADRDFRREVQAVFQDPYGALSPRMRIDRIIAEPLEAQGADRATIRSRTAELVERVGLRADMLTRYPHEFSGGQRQRIAIARALSTNPRLLVLDEPVSALDVSVRAQILLLLRGMQREAGLTCVFIGHDLAVVRYLSTTVAVMYFGRLVEIGPAADVLARPLHPYTRRLVAVAAGSAALGATRIGGELPNPVKPPAGCVFRGRCAFAAERCAVEAPRRRRVGSREVACHFAETIEAPPGSPDAAPVPPPRTDRTRMHAC